jgi:hypothetical protein
MPQGIKNSRESFENQRNLRRNRLLTVPRNMGRMGMNQIDIKLPKTINKEFNNLVMLNTKVALIRKVKKN